MRSYRNLACLVALSLLIPTGFFILLPQAAPVKDPYLWPSGLEELWGILNPQVFSHRAQSASSKELAEQFLNPPAQYRSMPLWVWNDDLEWPRLQEQLLQFKNQGIGGVFVHPRPGLMTEYLGDKWFDLWTRAVAEGKKLGLSVNIYDENSYPSGFAGGHVPAAAPDTASQFVTFAQLKSTQKIPWKSAETLAVMAIVRNKSGDIQKSRRIFDLENVKTEESLLLFSLRRAGGNPWTAGFPYVDLMNPETGRMFLQTTFEEYKNRFSNEFGKTIKWVFDDEPLLATAGAYDSAQMALPLSRYILAEFRRRCGYDLADFLPSLYWDVNDFQKVRFDYWQTLHDLWKENYLRPLFFWCDRNGLQFTGHWMEHEWPYPWITPADASLYAYEHVPGIDMLEGTNLRLQGKDPHMLFTIKQVASVAHQLGRRAFCEAYGVAGWDSTLEHYKRFGDWLMVHGINFMSQHLSFSTIRGARKRDHPQSFSDVAPWWSYYRYHADHLARVSYMLSQGQTHNRVLVLEPTTTGFLWARRGGETPELEKMRSDFDALVQAMADHQMDFDLGDEYILEWFGKQKGSCLQVGNASYDVIVWPENLLNVRHQTIPILRSFLSAGGTVVALSDGAYYVDGRKDASIPNWSAEFSKQWIRVSNRTSMLKELQHRCPPRIYFEHPLSSVGVYERFLENGERIIFLANSGLNAIHENITITRAGSVESWDTVSGEIKKIAVCPEKGKTQFGVDLAPAGNALFITREKVDECAERATERSMGDFEEMHPSWKITAESDNVLVLDYCDLRLKGELFKNINTWEANWKIWQSHGFERPAWDNAVQFQTRVFDRNHFSEKSGFDVKFEFQIENVNELNKIDLAVESSELYQIRVNNRPVSFVEGIRWLDPHIKRIPIQTYLASGRNEVQILASPFDVRMEMENIYLVGNFVVSPKSKGFMIKKPVSLNFGSWAEQGYPFYSGVVRYEAEISVRGVKKGLQIKLPNLQGALAQIVVDNKPSAILAWPPYEAFFYLRELNKHSLSIKVVSTPRNLFGPFHNPEKLRMRAWPAAWADFPQNQPEGKGYDFVEYGLIKEPLISLK